MVTKGVCKVVRAVFHDMIRVYNSTTKVRLQMSKPVGSFAFDRSVCVFVLRNYNYFSSNFGRVPIVQRLMNRVLWIHKTIRHV